MPGMISPFTSLVRSTVWLCPTVAAPVPTVGPESIARRLPAATKVFPATSPTVSVEVIVGAFKVLKFAVNVPLPLTATVTE